MLLSIFAYCIVPDNSHNANSQNIELAKLAPMTKVSFVSFKENDSNKTSFFTFFWNGKSVNSKLVALASPQSIEIEGNNVQLTLHTGALATYSLSMFAFPEKNKTDFIAKNVHAQTFFLGTDSYGRDVLSRLILGARVSLAIGLLATLLSVCIGFVLGATAGFLGGKIDALLMGIISVIWAIPTLLLAIVLGFVMGTGFWQLMLAIALSNWVEIARLVRGQVLSIKNLPYIEATQALGISSRRTLFRHILPNILSPLIVMAVSNFGSAVLVESGLSFLGLGVEVGVPTWGRMVFDGYNYILFENGKWLAIFPGIALILLVVSINLLGNGLRDALIQNTTNN